MESSHRLLLNPNGESIYTGVEEKLSMIPYAGNVVTGANPIREEAISDFPGKDRRALPFVLSNPMDDTHGGHAWFTPPNCPRSD